MTSPLTMHQMIEARGILPPAYNVGLEKSRQVRAVKTAERRRAVLQLVAANAGAAEIRAVVGFSTVDAVSVYASKHKIIIPRRDGCRPYFPAQSQQPKERQGVTITPNAMKAQAAMYRLIDAHFDPDAGRYADGWDDARVAKESGIAPGLVSAFRTNGFGALKTSPELLAISDEVKALKDLLAGIEARLAKVGVRV